MAWRLVASLVAVVGLLAVLAPTQTAFARDDEHETEQGYLLVQQALSHLAHDTSPTGIDLALEKVDDALATQSQKGVDVAEVQRGMRALEATHVDQARELLQSSIGEALSRQPAATGYETGTTVVDSALPGRAGLTGQDLGLLIGSAATVLLGLVLAYRFRPRDSVRKLRGQLVGAEAAAAAADAGTSRSSGVETGP